MHMMQQVCEGFKKVLSEHIFNVIKKHIIKIFNNKYLIKKHIHLRVSISLILIVGNVEFLLLPVVDVIKLFLEEI